MVRESTRIDPIRQPCQTGPVHPILHITQYDIRKRALPDRLHLHAELRRPDPPPDQRSIEDDRFHKAVPGASEGPVLQRFLHASGGIGPAVNGETVRHPVYEQAGDVGEQILQHLFCAGQHFCLYIRKILKLKLLRRIRQILRIQAVEILQQLFQNVILDQSVDKEQTGRVPCDKQLFFQNVKILLCMKKPAHGRDIFSVIFRKFFHKHHLRSSMPEECMNYHSSAGAFMQKLHAGWERSECPVSERFFFFNLLKFQRRFQIFDYHRDILCRKGRKKLR